MRKKTQPTLLLLDCPTKNYDWGSMSAMSDLLDLPRTPKPVAEFWMGAHPLAPSLVQGQSLAEWIDKEPLRFLGERVSKSYGRLPFLMKLLAAEHPLSIQTHPTKEQAGIGYKAENQKNIPLEDFCRVYKDSSDKPELLVALSDFEVLCGFRPIHEIIEEFEKRKLNRLLAHGETATEECFYRQTATSLLKLSGYELQDNLKLLEKTLGNQPRDRLLKSLLDRRPGDVGVLVSLLLHHKVLRQGEGVFLEPGVLHAYVRGLGIEIMASSDNVVRAGLTNKHVDIDELLRITRFKNFDFRPLAKKPTPNGLLSYSTPTESFELVYRKLNSHSHFKIKSFGPQIVFVLNGRCRATQAGQEVIMLPSTPCFVCANTEVELDGEAELYIARMPQSI